MGGIYGIKNNLTEQIIYVGKSVNFDRRRWSHFCYARTSGGGCRKLYAIMKKHGPENFSFVVLQDEIEDPRHLLLAEGQWARALETLASMGKGGANLVDPWMEAGRSDEWSRKVAESNRLRSSDPIWRERVSLGARKRAENPQWRANVTEANRKRGLDISWRESQRMLAQSQDWKEKNALAATRRSNSPEWKLKMSQVSAWRLKPVVCVETGVLYQGARPAFHETGISQKNITSVCTGNRKSAGGFHWRYATSEENELYKKPEPLAARDQE